MAVEMILIGALAWITLIVVVIAACRVAAKGDADAAIRATRPLRVVRTSGETPATDAGLPAKAPAPHRLGAASPTSPDGRTRRGSSAAAP